MTDDRERLVEVMARAICSADDVDPEKECPGLGYLIPVGEVWPAWRVRKPHARAALEAYLAEQREDAP